MYSTKEPWEFESPLMEPHSERKKEPMFPYSERQGPKYPECLVQEVPVLKYLPG